MEAGLGVVDMVVVVGMEGADTAGRMGTRRMVFTIRFAVPTSLCIILHFIIHPYLFIA